MSYKVKDKNRTYHFFNDIMSIENFDVTDFKKDENSYKNILIYCNHSFWQKDWALSYHSIKFQDFTDIS